MQLLQDKLGEARESQAHVPGEKVRVVEGLAARLLLEVITGAVDDQEHDHVDEDKDVREKKVRVAEELGARLLLEVQRL